jgi:hypothetical protein
MKNDFAIESERPDFGARSPISANSVGAPFDLPLRPANRSMGNPVSVARILASRRNQ